VNMVLGEEPLCWGRRGGHGKVTNYLEAPGCFNLSDQRRDPEVGSVDVLREGNFRTGAFLLRLMPSPLR
jgi:hypothetical protein